MGVEFERTAESKSHRHGLKHPDDASREGEEGDDQHQECSSLECCHFSKADILVPQVTTVEFGH